MTEELDYHMTCGENCSLREGTRWGDRATELLREGKSLRAVIAVAAAEGYKLNIATLSRHKKHIVANEPDAEVDASPRVSNIEILETIIAMGFKNRRNWKPTIGDTMKAMDQWFKLTQGNPFDELLDALANATQDDDEDDENPAAVAMPDEQEAVIDSEG